MKNTSHRGERSPFAEFERKLEPRFAELRPSFERDKEIKTLGVHSTTQRVS